MLKYKLEKFDISKLKQENEELKVMCKELQKQLKEKDYLNAKVGRKKTIAINQREDIRRKYANGTSMNKLAIDYNTSKTTIHKIIKKEVNN
jgi:DNA invertase Pin-like site-specific DNA recombinase